MTPFIVATAIFLAVIWLWSGLHKIPTGWKALRTRFGKRTHTEVEEGWQLAPWPWGLKLADCRQIIDELDDQEAVTQDDVPVKVRGSYSHQIVDLYKYFDVDASRVKRGLDDARDQEIRAIIRQYPLNTALSMQVDMAEVAKENLRSKACATWGIEIPSLLIARIVPNKAVEEDLELKKREELQREGQKVELKHFADRVQELMIPLPKGPGLTREQAIEQVQMSMGYVKKDAKTQSLTLDPATAELVGKILGRK